MERFDTQWEGPLSARRVPSATAGASQKKKNPCRCGDLERTEGLFVYLCGGVSECLLLATRWLVAGQMNQTHLTHLTLDGMFLMSMGEIFIVLPFKNSNKRLK